MLMNKNAANQKARNNPAAMPIPSPNNQAYLNEVEEINRNISKMRARQMRAYQEAEHVYICHGNVYV